MNRRRFHRVTLAVLLAGVAGLGGCGSDEHGSSGPLRVSVLHARWLHGKGLDTLGTPAPAYYPDGLWDVIQRQFPGQHERGVLPWWLEAFEIRPLVDGHLELDLVDHTKREGPDRAGVQRALERWTLRAGTRHVLVLAMGPARTEGGGASVFRALLLDVEGPVEDGAGTVTGVAHGMEVSLPDVPEGTPPGRWHQIGDPGLPVIDLMAFTGAMEQELQLLVWAPDPTEPVSYQHSQVPQIHGREVIKGEYEYPLVALTLRYP